LILTPAKYENFSHGKKEIFVFFVFFVVNLWNDDGLLFPFGEGGGNLFLHGHD